MFRNDLAERYNTNIEHEEKRGTVRGIKRKALAPCKKPVRVMPAKIPNIPVKFFEEIHHDGLFSRADSSGTKRHNTVLPDSRRSRECRMVVRGAAWTREQEKTLVRMRKGGAAWPTIAQAVGHTAKACLCRYSVLTGAPGSRERWTDDEKETALRLHNRGCTSTEISKVINRPAASVRHFIQKRKGKK